MNGLAHLKSGIEYYNESGIAYKKQKGSPQVDREKN